MSECSVVDTQYETVGQVGKVTCKGNTYDADISLSRNAIGADRRECVDRNTEFSLIDETDIPEKGLRAYFVVLGSFCGLVMIFGFANSTGAIQDYLVSERLQSYSQSSIGWIFSLWSFFLYFCGVQIGPIFDTYGVRVLLIPGCIGWIASIFILSVCQKYYQIMLGFSVLGGICGSMVFNPCITAIGHWFSRYRGVATGIATTGGSVGGIFIPLMLNRLFPLVGYGWAIRTLAFIMLVLAIVTFLAVDSRHNSAHKSHWTDAVIDLRSLLYKDFAAVVLGTFLVEWACFVPILYIVSYARTQGFSRAYSNALIAYMNVGSTVGRLVPGYVADRWGTFNVMIVTSAITGILCLALWLPAGDSKAGLTIFVIMFGVWSGSTIGVTPLCVSAVSQTKEYGKRYGTAYSISSFAVLTGLPIAGSLTGNNYLGLIIFSGVVYIFGAVAFTAAKIWSADHK